MSYKLDDLFTYPESETGDLRIAIAALLVKAAMSDNRFDQSERQTVETLLSRRFRIDARDVDILLDRVMEYLVNSAGLYSCSMVISEELEESDRNQLMEMMWEVVYADGMVHDFEASLMRRLAPLIEVEDEECERIGETVRLRRAAAGH